MQMPLLVALGVGALLLFGLWRLRSGETGPDSLEDIGAGLDREALASLPPEDLDARVRGLLERRRKIEAIKLVRLATGMGLKEAKDYVERL